MEIDFEQRLREVCILIEKNGQEYAKWKPVANNLDDLKKTILSEEMLKCQDEPAWKAEAKARVSDVYKQHLEAVKEAEHNANSAWAKLEASKARFEALRTLCSLQKTSMKIFQE